MVAVRDRVRVRADGGSVAARKYAGRHGQVVSVAPGTAPAPTFVRVDGNHALETAFEERYVLKLDEQEEGRSASPARGRDRGDLD